MSTHIELAYMCSNNFCPFSYALFTYFIKYKYIVISFDGGGIQIFLCTPPLDPPKKFKVGGQYTFYTPHPPSKHFCVWGWSIYFL